LARKAVRKALLALLHLLSFSLFDFWYGRFFGRFINCSSFKKAVIIVNTIGSTFFFVVLRRLTQLNLLDEGFSRSLRNFTRTK